MSTLPHKPYLCTTSKDKTMASYEEYDEEAEKPEYAEEYRETKSFQCCARCCGRCWFLTLCFCIIAWIAHSIILASPDPCFLAALRAEQQGVDNYECTQADVDAGQAHWDLAPRYTKTLIWMSMAHHTDGWKEHWERSAPPPPPDFFRS